MALLATMATNIMQGQSMAQLIHQLKHWQENGLLSESQLNAILKFEESKPKNSWALMGFLTLGFAIVVLGIIAIIASNWMNILDGAKLGLGFALLIGTAFAIYRLRDNPSTWINDGVKGFFALLCLAMIGLIAQIYHLKGDGYSSGLLWSVMTLILISEAKNILVPFFWTIIFASSFFWGLIVNPNAKEYIAEPCSLFILLFTVIFLILRHFKKDAVLTRSMGQAVLLIWIFGISFSSVRWYHSGSFHSAEYKFLEFLPHYLISIGIGIALFMDPSLKKMEKNFFLVGLFLANLLFSLNLMVQESYVALIAIGIACLLTIAFFFLSREKSRLFNAILIIISIKFLEVYVHKFGGLLTTGVGLIVTGLALLGLVYGWAKHRHKIEGRLKEWLL
jgi:hypothetical protein